MTKREMQVETSVGEDCCKKVKRMIKLDWLSSDDSIFELIGKVLVFGSLTSYLFSYNIERTARDMVASLFHHVKKPRIHQ